jgi:FixJ family two-component response regulator
MKACVVDDDYTSRVLLRDFLEDMGWGVLLFSHPERISEKGTSLVEDLSDNNTKLLVMDVRFGRDADGLTKGLKVTEILANEGKLNQNCRVVFISQFGKVRVQFDSVEKTLLSKGINFDWLDKPVDFVLLNLIVQDIAPSS